MTFISTMMRLKAPTIAAYERTKGRLLKAGYWITKDYESATHFFNENGIEVIINKIYSKEVAASGRT